MTEPWQRPRCPTSPYFRPPLHRGSATEYQIIVRAFAPMPLRRAREPFDDPGWLYELKLDGFRALAHVDRGQCRLVSRNGHTFKGWPGLATAIATAIRAESAVLDGEVVCLDADGRPDFKAPLFRRAVPVLYAFDLLMLDGQDVREKPLLARKRLLRRVLPRRSGQVLYLDHVAGRGIDLFRAVCEMDLEGIVAKRKDGIYDPDATMWVKVKNASYSQARDRWELFERRAVNGRR